VFYLDGEMLAPGEWLRRTREKVQSPQ